MPTKYLTDLFVEKIKPTKGRRTEYFDSTFKGLALRVSESGHKAWILFYRANGKQRRHTFDVRPLAKVDAARKAAAELLAKVAEGIDPLAEKRAVRNGPVVAVETFETALGKYLAHRKVRPSKRRKTPMKASTLAETKRSLERDVLKAGKWGPLALKSITRQHVEAITDRLIAEGKHVHANRIHARLSAFFNWAVDIGHLAASPMAGLALPAHESSRERVLGHNEMRWFWAACQEVDWPFGSIGQLLLLTAQRRTEVGDMDWSEVDIENAVWTIPAQRTKNGREHKVHLSPLALRILKGMKPRDRGLVFSTTGERAVSGYSRGKDRIDAEMIRARRRELGQPENDDDLRRHLDIPTAKPLPTEIEPWTFHDLRRSAATHMAERLKIAPHVVDKILNHTSGAISGVAAIYNRSAYLEERAAALDQWSEWIGTLVAAPAPTAAPANVVELRKRRR